MEYILLVALLFPTHAQSYQVDFATQQACAAAHAKLVSENNRVDKVLRDSQSKMASPFLFAVCLSRK